MVNFACWLISLPWSQAAACNPETHRLAAWLDARTATEQRLGGRPRAYPTVVMLVFGEAISIFGSANAVANNWRDPDVWAITCAALRPLLDPGVELPARGPERYHWEYFLKHRLAPHRAAFATEQMRGATRLATDLGLADPTTGSLNRLDRLHSVVTDGKVFTSPLGTREVTSVDKTTGEIRTIRQDDGRGRHHEGGDERNYVWGCKYAISSIRSRLEGVRVILGVQHIAVDGRGEAGAFVDLATQIAEQLPAVNAYIYDGALRGQHIDAIQSATGALVVVPPRRRTGKAGGIKIANTFYAARVLPESKARLAQFATCDGHDLWAAGGHLLERITTVDGTDTFHVLARVGLKRQRKQDRTWMLMAKHRFTCRHTGQLHEWHESLTATDHDRSVNFNRAEYVRAVAASDPDFDRVYGFRSDAESLNAQLEYGWHKQRIPAWGEANETCLVLLAALGHNAWARHAWQRHLDSQAAGPPPAA